MVDDLTAGISSDSEHVLSAQSSSSKVKLRVFRKVINCVCEQNVDVSPLIQVCNSVTTICSGVNLMPGLVLQLWAHHIQWKISLEREHCYFCCCFCSFSNVPTYSGLLDVGRVPRGTGIQRKVWDIAGVNFLQCLSNIIRALKGRKNRSRMKTQLCHQ